MRILVYCQHVLGIGHLVRTFEILKALDEHQVTLLLGGSASNLSAPEKVTTIQLPPLMMDVDFSALSAQEGQAVETVKKQRQHILSKTVAMLQPDVLLVELYPFGRNSFHFEIAPLLEQAVLSNPHCLRVSSVRDILVDRSNKEKFEARAVNRMNRYFNLLLIHSDPAVITLDETFSRMHDITTQTVYTGYIHRPPSERSSSLSVQCQRPLIIASAGGGSVGGDLLLATVRAHALLSRQFPCTLQLYTGPYVNSRCRERLQAAAGPGASIAPFCDDLPAALRAADLSISMGGYNTTMDVVAAGCPALIHPFSQNHEQRLRAKRLGSHFPLTVLEKEDLEPQRLAQHIRTALAASPLKKAAGIRLDGARVSAQTITLAAQT